MGIVAAFSQLRWLQSRGLFTRIEREEQRQKKETDLWRGKGGVYNTVVNEIGWTQERTATDLGLKQQVVSKAIKMVASQGLPWRIASGLWGLPECERQGREGMSKGSGLPQGNVF